MVANLFLLFVLPDYQLAPVTPGARHNHEWFDRQSRAHLNLICMPYVLTFQRTQKQRMTSWSNSARIWLS